MMRAPLLLPLVAVLLMTTAPVSAETEVPADTTVALAPVLPAITVSRVETRLMRDIVLASGLIAPVQQVQVAPLVEGQPIEELLADVGDKVEAGQVLARLSTSTLSLQLAQFEASLAASRAAIAQAEAQMTDAKSAAEEANRVSERTTALQKQGTTSQAALDKAVAGAVSAMSRVAVATQSLEAARANLSLVEAQLENTKLMLSRAEVKAPFAGEITARNALLGGVASAAGLPMFTLIRDNALELRADVAEADLMRLAVGQKASLRTVNSTAPLTGTIRLVEPTIDAQTRLGHVRITLDDASAVRAGMFAEAEILIAERETNVLPVTAVSTDAGSARAMKVVDGTASLVAVEVGIRDGDFVEVLSGLELGDGAVTKAGAFVRDGDQINPVPAIPVSTN